MQIDVLTFGDEFGMARCTIRSWRWGDETALVRHANNRKVWQNLRDRFPHPYTKGDAQRYLQIMVEAVPETNFVIALDNELVGAVGFALGHDIERIGAEVGYWLGEDVWGRGIATAAVRTITRHAFATFPLERLFAVPFVTNAASLRVLEKAGYTREGILRRSALKDGRVLDQAMYSITRPEVL